MMPTVTIVIPFYNCQYIQQALESAVQQTYPAVEIIVVDDGSTQYSHLIAPYMNRVYYMGKSNGGTASALNHGICMLPVIILPGSVRMIVMSPKD